MGTFALRLNGGEKRYPSASTPVFQGLDIELGQGELLVLLGSSGCGKSTLLRCLAGLEPFSAGRLGLSHHVESRPATVGLVFQEPRLMPWLNVHDNVALGLGFRRNHKLRADADVPGLLSVLGLSELASATPAQLSGGQAQRVSLARSIVTRPDVLLLDEPFGALDPATRSTLQSWLLELRRQFELSILLVTHDIDEALRLGDRVLLMSTSPGTIAHSWIPEARTSPGLEGLRAEILERYPGAIP